MLVRVAWIASAYAMWWQDVCALAVTVPLQSLTPVGWFVLLIGPWPWFWQPCTVQDVAPRFRHMWRHA